MLATSSHSAGRVNAQRQFSTMFGENSDFREQSASGWNKVGRATSVTRKSGRVIAERGDKWR